MNFYFEKFGSGNNKLKTLRKDVKKKIDNFIFRLDKLGHMINIY